MNNIKYKLKLGSCLYPLICEESDFVFLERHAQELNNSFHAIAKQYNFRLRNEEVFLLMMLHYFQEKKADLCNNEVYVHKLDSKDSECIMNEIYFRLYDSLEDVLS